MMKKTDSGTLIETEASPEKKLEATSEEQVDTSAWDNIIELILNLDPDKYGKPFSDVELQKMCEIVSAGRGKFPKKVIPYVELMRKFLFANYQLIALAALAHKTAQDKSKEEKQLVKPANFSDLGKIEAEKLKNQGS